MYIAILMDDKVCVSNVSMVDLLDLEDRIDEIYEWLNNPDAWPVDELHRLISEVATSFFGVDGCLEDSDYEDFRFLLQILPDEIDEVPLMVILEGELEDVEIDAENYALFLDWLSREEVTMMPGEAGRVFEYALATAPEEALEYYLILATEHDGHEAMINLARTELYTYVGDAYFAALLELCDTNTAMTVLQILGDQAAEKNADISDMEDMLCDAHEIIVELCERAGIDPMSILGDDCGDEIPEESDINTAADGDTAKPPDETGRVVPEEPPATEPEGGPPEEGPGATPPADE